MYDISIIVAIRNEENSIMGLIRSIKNQIFKGTYEVILIDGMSDDNTLDVITNFVESEQMSNYKIILNEERFVSYGLNKGVEIAQGRYFCRLDGRFEISPNYLSECLCAVEEGFYSVVGGRLLNYGRSKMATRIAKAMSSSMGVGIGNFRTKQQSNNSILPVDTVTGIFCRMSAIRSLGGYDDSFIRSQDEELNFRFVAAGLKIGIINSISIKYEVRATLQSLSKQYFQYGFWKVRVSKKHRRVIVLRQLIPPVFTLYLLGLIPLLMATSWFIVPLILYLFFFIWSFGINTFALIIPTFLMHLSYGLGAIYSVFHKSSPKSVTELSR
jgi:glycosyltransferase involved in cell wall biosynthesis